MDLTVVIALYVIAGAIVYFLTDTLPLVSRIESATPLPWGTVQSAVFVLVVALWPLWLWLRPRSDTE